MVVIGNGESRKLINLSEIKSETIGCNAIFRDCIVDHLVCVDRRTLKEAINHENTKHTMIYTRPDWLNMYTSVFEVPELFYEGKERPDKPMHRGSGQFALLVAIDNCNSENIDIIGFDLYGNDNKINNIYKGTKSYENDNSHAVDPRYWIYQNKKIFEYFSKFTFNYYVNNSFKVPDSWTGLKNLKIKDIKKYEY